MKTEFSTADSSDSDGVNDYRDEGGITTLFPQLDTQVFLSENNQAVFYMEARKEGHVQKESLDPKKISWAPCA